MYIIFGKVVHNVPCRKQIFFGLFLAMSIIFISKDNKSFAFDFPTPTPVSSFDYISISILDYDPSLSVNDRLYPEKYPFLDYSIDSSRLGDGSSFYTTFYKSALFNAIDNASSYLGADINISSTVIDLFMNKFSDLYPFDPYNYLYGINTFIDVAGNLYFVPDYSINNRLPSLPCYYYSDSNGYQKYIPYGILPFFACSRLNNNLYYLGSSVPSYSTSDSSTSFGLCNGVILSQEGRNFYSLSSSQVSSFSDIEFYNLTYDNLSSSATNSYVYCYHSSTGKFSWAPGFQISSSYLYPLVLMTNIYRSGDTITYNDIEYSFTFRKWNNYYVSFYVNPKLDTNVDLTLSDFYSFTVNFNLSDYLKPITSGLSYFNSGFIDPAVLYTPTPFPTLIVNATLTPIILPLDPDLSGISDGNIFGTTQGYIEMLVSVLNGPIPRFFSELISYVYASHFTFYIMLFVPIVIFITFIIGRLHKK